MAVTEQTYTGNGSTTNYSFTFPYLKSSDITVQVDAAVTTAWSLSNATTVQFNSAPANGAIIKILRKTNVDNLTATFYAGSAIKSEDLNDNYTQNLYVTQEIGNRSFENTGLSTMIGDLTMGEDTKIVFEGATDNAYETTLTVADPTADRTITLPNVTGTVVTTGDTGTVAHAMLAGDAVDGDNIGDDVINSEHIAAGAVDLEHMSANSVDSDQYVDGSIDHVHLANDVIDGDNIQDDVINSEHIAAGAVDLEHMSANSVDSDQYVDGSIDSAHIANDQIDSQHYAAGSIDLEHMSANSVDSDQYVDGSIDSAHIANDQIDSQHYAAGSIDLEHMSANSVDSDQYVDGSIDRIHLEADIIDSTKLADNAVGTEHIADAELTTLAGMQSGTASVLAGSTALTSTLDELNMLDGKSIVTSISGSSTDVQLPTAKAVDDRVTALVTDVGGFVPIANETSFPTTNPDPEDNAGTIVSVKALASNLTSNGSGVATIANGAGSGNTVTINGMANSDTIEAGKGILVETTSTLHTYTFHRETLAPADITAAKSAVDDFNSRYRVNAGEPSSSLDDGDLVWDTNADKMKVYNATASAWEEVTSTGQFKYLFLCPFGGTGAPTIDGSVDKYDLREGSNSGAAASITNAAQLIVSVNGVIQKANTGTSAPSEGFALVDANTIIFGTDLPNNANVFIIQIGAAVSIPTPGDDTVSTVKIQNLAVNTSKIANDAINADKLDTNSVTSDALASNSVASAELYAGSGSNGQYLQYDGTAAGGLAWATVETSVADGCIYLNNQTISSTYTMPSGKNGMSAGPITISGSVTIPTGGSWSIV